MKILNLKNHKLSNFQCDCACPDANCVNISKKLNKVKTQITYAINYEKNNNI